ncbi:neuropeptide CCHamide-1 receptor-like [Homalodisca vitripennis]|uniref:neuropeptide CCHamide-1 receptor-like n=1 Tax=Homalodisca vitripennis TaxID=197043 RepID=UPI001EEC5C95|nr:neuropeptide CCHamide-1 receptor-like [Homalodisca vitripennis]
MFNITIDEELINITSVAEVTNKSSTEIPPYPDRPETYYVPVLFSLIFLVGVVGNGTLVVIFIRHRTMRNVPNTYILSLALGDLLVIVSCVPFTSTIYTVPNWPFGEFVCKLSETTKDISIGVSVFTLTALSADRFFAIVDPIRKQFSTIGGRGATRVTVMIASAIWGLAVIFSLPAAFGSHVKGISLNDSTLVVCYPFPDEYGFKYAQGVIVLRFLIYYTIPLSIIGFFYVMMARHLILSTHNMPGELHPPQARQIRARKKVAKTVLAFVIIFFVCFFPNHVFFLWFYFSPDPEADYNAFWHHLRIVGFCLAFFNSCINPIALYCVSGTFRKHFDSYLCCWKDSARKTRSSHRKRVGTRKWDSTSAPLHLQSTLRRAERTTATGECTVTTFTNGAGEM